MDILAIELLVKYYIKRIFASGKKLKNASTPHSHNQICTTSDSNYDQQLADVAAICLHRTPLWP